MANNRLYIGNLATKEYSFLSKGWGMKWSAYDAGKNFENFLNKTDTFDESNMGETALFLFTEDHRSFNKIKKEYTKIPCLSYSELDNVSFRERIKNFIYKCL